MEFTSDTIDFFVQDPAHIGAANIDGVQQLKCRMCVGYVIGNQLYHTQRMGAMWPLFPSDTDVRERMIEASRRTYEQISESGEITIAIFAYHLGVPCEWDDPGLPIGEWPQIGAMVLRYQEKFLMPGGQLPQNYRHVLPIRLWS